MYLFQVLAQKINNPFITNTAIRDLSGYDFINRIIPTFVSLAFIVGVVVFLFILVLGGISWITSAGNKAALEKARDRITQALIGLFILFALFALIQLINLIFGINIGDLGVPSSPPTGLPGATSTPPSGGACTCVNGTVTVNGCTPPEIAACSSDTVCNCIIEDPNPTPDPTVCVPTNISPADGSVFSAGQSTLFTWSTCPGNVKYQWRSYRVFEPPPLTYIGSGILSTPSYTSAPPPGLGWVRGWMARACTSYNVGASDCFEFGDWSAPFEAWYGGGPPTSVLLNSATGVDCNDLCQSSSGGLCLVSGDNTSANNGIYHRVTGGVCDTGTNYCTTNMIDQGQTCVDPNDPFAKAFQARWTRCLCSS